MQGYYIEPTEYFLRLSEASLKYAANSRIGLMRGRVKTLGIINPGMVVPVLSYSRAGKLIPYQMYFGVSTTDGWLITEVKREEAATHPVFKGSWTSRRCIVPASWYYEYQQKKQSDGSVVKGDKFFVQPKGEDKIFMCALYRYDGSIPCFAIVTIKAGKDTSHIYGRMPLIIPEERIEDWTDPAKGPEVAADSPLTAMFCERLQRPDPDVSEGYDGDGRKTYMYIK